MKKKLLGFMVLLSLLLIPTVFASGENKTIADLILNKEGKLVINSVPPKNEDDAFVLLGDYTFYNIKEATPKYDNEKYGDGEIDVSTCNKDYTKCTLKVRKYMSAEILLEKEIDIVYNYDENVKKQLDELINKFPKDIENFEVTDLELINYWINVTEEDDDHLDNYSTQLKSYLNHANIDFYVDNRAGDDSPFYNLRIGIATLSYDGIIYYMDNFLGTKATNSIAVPDDTTDVLAAAQKRVDEYLGKKDAVKIELGGTVAEWIEGYKAEIMEEWENSYESNRQMYVASYNTCVAANGENSPYCANIIPEYYSTFEKYIAYSDYSYDDYEVLSFLEESGETNYYRATINGITRYFLIIKDSKLMKNPKLSTNDLNTNVSVSTESTTLPLDTTVKSKKLESGEEYNKIMETLQITKGTTYDLTLYSNTLGDYIKKIDDNTFEVKLPIDESLEGKELIVYYVTTDNKVEEHKVTVKDGCATFTTNHFSIYTLTEKKIENATEETKVEEQKEETSISPKTGDSISLYILLMVLGVSGFITIKTTCKE